MSYMLKFEVRFAMRPGSILAMIPKISERAVDSCLDVVGELVSNPKTIVDEAKLVEKEMMKAMKSFFLAATGEKLYTDNMDDEQIWEQIDEKLSDMRPILKARVKKIAKDDSIDLDSLIVEESEPEEQQESAEEAEEQGDAESSSDDSEEETGDLADILNRRARAAGLADYDDADDDEEALMGPKPTKAGEEGSEDEDEEDEDEEDDLDMDGIDEEGLMDDFDGEEDEDAEEGAEEDGEEVDGEEDEDAEEEEDMNMEDEPEDDEEANKAKKLRKDLFDEDSTSSSFAALMMRDAKLDQEMDAFERSLVGDKHWTMTGEVNAMARPKNSLLEQHLELPSYKKADLAPDGQLPDSLGGLEEGEDAVDFNTKLTLAIEQLVIRRIKDLNFDDVERKAPPKLQKDDEEEAEILDFSKSKKSLGELYEEDFRDEVLGEKKETDKATQAAHEDIAKLMAKLFFNLDALANHRHMARPAKIGGAAKNIEAMRVEEAVPVTMSTALQKAPRELHHVAHELQVGEMSQDEKRALRNAKKNRRDAALTGRLAEGELTLAGYKERKEKLDAKNQQASKDRASMKSTGLTAAQAEKDNYRLNKKINTTELMARAQQLNSFKVENKKGQGPRLAELRTRPGQKKGGKPMRK